MLLDIISTATWDKANRLNKVRFASISYCARGLYESLSGLRSNFME